MEYKQLAQYGRNALIGTLAYTMSGCASMNLNARLEGTIQDPKPVVSLTNFGNEKPTLYAAAPLEKRVATDASSSNQKTKEDKPFYKTWWFLTGIGVAAIGGIVAATSGSKGGEAPPTSGPTPNPTPTPDPCPENNCGQ